MTRREHCQKIASAKRLETLTKAINAIDLLSKTNEPITISSVAAQSGVSRSWLYNEPLIKTLIAGFSSHSDSQVLSLVSSLEQAIDRIEKLESQLRSIHQTMFDSSLNFQQN